MQAFNSMMNVLVPILMEQYFFSFATLPMGRNILEPLEFEIKVGVSFAVGAIQGRDDILELLGRDNCTPLSCIAIQCLHHLKQL